MSDGNEASLSREQIECGHIVRGDNRPFFQLDIGNDRAVVLCQRCWQSIVGIVLGELAENVVKALMQEGVRDGIVTVNG